MIDELQLSLPTRERGLKYCLAGGNNIKRVSLPTRERGLKSRRPREANAWGGRSLHGSVD